MSVGQADRVVAEPILNEEEVAPPIFSADVRVRCHDEIPHRAGAEQRQNVSAKKNQKDDRWDDAEIPVEEFTPNDNVATSLKPADERVSRQQTAQHKENVGVEGSR